MSGSESSIKKSQFDELLTRGVFEVIVKDDLEKKLCSGKKLRIKFGIDPTSPNIHIGRAVILLKLRDFQKLGHQIVFIIGDFTGVIGDTSDKESERPMLSSELVRKNFTTYKEQAGKLLDMKKVEFHYNSEWLAKLGYWEICEQADLFSLSEFIARDNIRRRLDKGTRISLREVLYPLMQGYDSVMIKSSVEIGGTDQRFNMLAGRDLQKHHGQELQSVITMNLILGTDGRKMSSSWGNTINLTDEPNDMFGKVMSIPDTLIPDYFIHCTRVPIQEISELEVKIKGGFINPRDVKLRLAYEITSLYHGREKAKNSEENFIFVFQQKKIPSALPAVMINVASLMLVDLIVQSGLAKSKSEARRLITQKAIKIDKELLMEDKKIDIPPGGCVLQRGSRHFIRIVKK